MDEKSARLDAIKALRMAKAGRCRCRKCGVEVGLQDALTSWFGGALVFAICEACLIAGNQVVVRRVPAGLEVVTNREAAPLVVVPHAGPSLPVNEPAPVVAATVKVEHDPDVPLALGGLP